MTGYIVIAFLEDFLKETLNEWLRPHGECMLHEIVKELRGSVQKVATGCLGDYFQKVISMYSLITL